MSMDITTALRAYASTPKAGASTGTVGEASGGFGEMLTKTLDEAVKTTRQGEAAMAGGTAGKAELVDVVTAVANAETTLETVVAMRDRVIGAYQEIMRMPI